MNAQLQPAISIDDFENGNIDPKRFDHESHVYMGWLYVREFGAAKALARFDAAIKRLVTLLGAESKYHATITWFFLLLIAERDQGHESWLQFKQRNPDIVAGSRRVLSHYYSEDYLFSSEARGRFLLPNRLADT